MRRKGRKIVKAMNKGVEGRGEEDELESRKEMMNVADELAMASVVGSEGSIAIMHS